MKKIFVIALAALSMCFVSCKKNVEDQAKDYVDQMMEVLKSGDEEKGEAIEAEYQKWMESLSEEDQAKAKKVMEDEMMKHLPELLGAMGGAMGELEDAAEELKDVTTDGADEISSALEEAGSALEDAASQLEDAVKEANE
ncbi:MAG: hypothetical protein MJZ35_00875 [Bacteroidaceae bacterium]|nr:hypothetical protein [Bacteroidaceae bacterium]